jgi:DNA-binding transcriptional MerR regulator
MGRSDLFTYDTETVGLLEFVRRAQRLGFTLVEIGEIVRMRRAGRAPCPHVRDLVRRKADELDQRLHDLEEVRDGLRHLLKRRRSASQGAAAVCPHIENTRRTSRIGEAGNLAVLRKGEWNVLVDLIRTGQLARL